MKKYKLLKWYPSLRTYYKVGDIIELINSGDYGKIPCILSAIEVESNPEFWEEIEEKEYEIIKLKAINSPSSKPISDDYSDGKVRWSIDDRPTWKSIETLLKEGDHIIYQVKRLSDGEIFTIGDPCHLKNGNGHRNPIVKFEITYNEYGTIKYRHRNTLKVWVNTMHNSPWGPFELDIIVKSPDKMFTTYDNVDIYTGDLYYYIVKHDRGIIPHAWEVLKHKVDWNNPSKPPLGSVQFNSDYKAEEYIKENKPKYSDKQVLDIIHETRHFSSNSSTKDIFNLVTKKYNVKV